KSKTRRSALPQQSGRALHQQSGRTRRPHDEGQAENLRRLPLHRRCNRLCGDPLLHLHRQKAGLERHPGYRPRPANPNKFSPYGVIRHYASRQTSWAVTLSQTTALYLSSSHIKGAHQPGGSQVVFTETSLATIMPPSGIVWFNFRPSLLVCPFIGGADMSA